MKEKEYISIGNPIITKDIFRNILRPLDNYGYKPTGGLWASEFTSNLGVCPWYDYLLDARGIASYMLHYKDLASASLFCLKKEANILTLNTETQILELANKYPSYHHLLNHYEEITPDNTIFDFDEISRIYDGIYVDYEKMMYKYKSRVFDTWSINTLLLFNLDCIEEYKTIKVNVDFDDIDPFPYIDSKNISDSKQVEEKSICYIELSKYIQNIFNELLPTYLVPPIINYDDYITKVINCAKKVLEIAEITKEKEISIIRDNLKNKGLTIDKKIIIRNLVLNYLSNYLYKEKESIKKLEPSKIKKTKYYSI